MANNQFIARNGLIALDDSQITGSLSLTGAVTGSIFSGSFVGDGSQLTGVTGATTASYVEYANVANKPTLVSGSSQITYSGLSGIPSGIVSGSSQITYSGLTGIPSGIVSGSSQVVYSGLTGIPSGIVSGSSQVTYSGLTGIPSGIVSGSSQITYSGLTGIPSGIVSGSSQVSYTGLSNIPSGIVSGSTQVAALGFATTGSNTFQANQTITGSLFISQNLIVAGSSSIQYISSSVVDIADNIITVNAFNPGVRFGGLAVADSGSSPRVSGSILFDSIKDQWIFVHENQTVVTSSVILMGPETYNDLGNESYISANRLPKGSGIEHLRDSNITDTGTAVSINSNTAVTGSFTVITGSAVELQVTNLGVNLGSALTDNHNITGSLRVTGSLNVVGAGTFSSTVTAGGNILVPAGSGLAWSGDATRIMTPEDNVSGALIQTPGIIRFNTSGSNRMTIAAAGNVGIGYTSPSYRLSVSGSSNSGIFLKQGSQIGDSPSGSNFYSALTFENTSTTNAWSMGYSQGAKFSINYFDASSTYSRYFTIAPGGNIGMGTINPAGELHIVNASGTGQPVLELEQLNAGSNILQWKGSAGSYLGVIQNDGNVGIGLTSPGSRLHIADGSSATRLIVDNTANAAAGAGVYLRTYNGATLVSNATVRTDNAGNFAIFTGTSSDGERMRITSGGNVGIGTTSPGSYRLNVETSSAPGIQLNGTGTGGSWMLWSNSGTATGYIASAWHLYTGGSVNDFGVRAENNLIFGISSTERMRITSGGFVGIRQTSPLAPLHVASESSADDANVQRWDYGGNSGYQLILKQTVTSGVVRWNFSQINNSTAFNNVLVLDRGNVGMGTTSPAQKLSVSNNIILGTAVSGATSTPSFIDTGVNYSNGATRDKLKIYLYNTGTEQYGFSVGSNADVQYHSNGTHDFYISNSQAVRIDSSGRVGIGTTSPQKPLEVISSANDFVSVGVRSLNVGEFTGIHFGYREANAAYRKSAIVFQRTDLTANNAQGKVHILNGPQGNACSATLADARLTIAENGNVGINSTSPAARLSVCSTTACSTVVDVQGCAGQLFSVTDNLVGEIFAVSDISGIPILSVNSNGTVSVDSKIAVGANHTVSGEYASVTGGRCNTASGFVSTVGGGFGNTASGCYSTVAGGGGCFGGGNSATSRGSTASGGRANTSSGYYASIGGGRENCSSGNFSTVAGGFRNTASGYGSVVGGGGGCFGRNCATGCHSTISGGTGNCASGDRSFIGGGLTNTASGDGNAIGGGRSNTASCYCSTVGGGNCNIASGTTSTVGGGRDNRASGQCSTVSGGSCNTASSYYSAVLGGFCNLAFGNTSTVGGGFNNRACGYTSIAGGGNNNTASGYAASVLGGRCNTASGTFSAVGNGQAQTASSCNEFRVSALSKASGTFRIDHPDPSKRYTHNLSHSFVESPTAGDNIYRYKVNIVNGQATITLPSYYKYLNENDQIWVTPQGHFGIGYGTVNAEQTQLTIYGNTDGEYNVLLIGTRKDTDAVEHWQGTETYK